MNRTLLLILVAFILLGAIAVGFWFVLRSQNSEPQQGEIPDPFGSVVEPVTDIPTGTLSTPLRNGQMVNIPDPRLLPQGENHFPNQGYAIGGSYEDSFIITFYPAEYDGYDRFHILLQEEPLGLARKAAETRLREYLGLPDSQVCALADIQVWAENDISEAYAGRNLGLSFCPGSTDLPE